MDEIGVAGPVIGNSQEGIFVNSDFAFVAPNQNTDGELFGNVGERIATKFIVIGWHFEDAVAHVGADTVCHIGTGIAAEGAGRHIASVITGGDDAANEDGCKEVFVFGNHDSEMAVADAEENFEVFGDVGQGIAAETIVVDK